MPMVRKRIQRELDDIRKRLQEEVRKNAGPDYDDFVVQPIKLLFFGEDPFPQEQDENVIVFPDEDAQLMVVKGSAVLGGAMAFSHDVTAADFEQSPTQGAEPSITDVLPMDLGFEVCVVDPTQFSGDIIL